MFRFFSSLLTIHMYSTPSMCGSVPGIDLNISTRTRALQH